MIEVVLWPVELLQLAREVTSHLNVLRLNLLLELQHQLQDLLILVVADRVVHHSLLGDVRELDGKLCIDVVLDLLPEGGGLGLELVLVGELFGDSIEVGEQLLEGVVVRLLELVEALAEGFG